jgi:hypothetical protein
MQRDRPGPGPITGGATGDFQQEVIDGMKFGQSRSLYNHGVINFQSSATDL